MNTLVKWEMTEGLNILLPLGDSYRMSLDERAKWERWNKEATELAAMYPNTVFMNGTDQVKAVCLSFDDAPDKHYTPLILDVLRRYGVKASFFIHGKRTERLKKIVQQISLEGHYLGCHTYTHPNLTEITPEQVRYEIEYSSEIIRKVTGKKPKIVRPPYGELNASVVETLALMDKKIMLWSTNTFDWLEKTPVNIIDNVVNNVRSGEVILLHSYTNKRPTVEALPYIIEALREKGYQFLGVDEMIGEQGYE